MKIIEMNKEQRPREKALRYGIESLSDEELIALMLQSGSRNRNVFSIAQDVLKTSNQLTTLFELHPNTLMEIDGISKAKALIILASLELSKRALKANVYKTAILNPQDVVGWFQMEYGLLKQEYFIALYLDNKSKVIKHSILFIGTLNESEVHPREIFKEAVVNSAYAIILSHNHPSGDPTPSKQDIDVTRKLYQASKMMGIFLADHIIIGKNNYFSFRQEKYLD